MPTFGLGGAEIVAVELANSLADAGWKVSMVVMAATGPLAERLSAEVDTIVLGAPSYRASIAALAQFFDHVRPDVVLSTLYINNLVCIAARMRSVHKPRVVAGAHNSLRFKVCHPDNLKDRFLLLPLSRLLMRFADLTIAVSHGVAEELRSMLKLPAERVRVVYNPVFKPELLDHAREAADHDWLNEQGGPPVLVTVGRLIEQKGHSDLIEAMALLNAARPIRLLVIGDGPLRGDLERQVSQLGLADKVDFVGMQANPFRYLARADAFVLSSRWEGLANVVIEALACGCPVIATDCNFGPREILQGETFGLLCAVGSPHALASQIEALLDEPTSSPRKDRAALLARATVFSRDNSVTGYQALLKQLLA